MAGLNLNGSGVYWFGQDGNVYVNGDNTNGVQSTSKAVYDSWQSSANNPFGKGFKQVEDPNTGGGGYAGPTAADERVYYDDQIANINRLLGVVGAQRDAGLDRLNRSFADQGARLGEQETKAMAGYDQQSLENSQDKQRGVESVDQFASNSYKSLQGILRGANSGNSSVARELVPYLVSKGAGTRRQGVFDQAGKNEQSIVSARGDAEDQFRYSREDLENQRKEQEQSFRTGILNKESDLLSQRGSLETARAQATGAGYAAARDAAAASQAGLAERQNQLAALFGQFAPTFNARATNLKTPELGRFTVDPAKISASSNLPTESSYYLTQLRKKEQGLL